MAQFVLSLIGRSNKNIQDAKQDVDEVMKKRRRDHIKFRVKRTPYTEHVNEYAANMATKVTKNNDLLYYKNLAIILRGSWWV